MVLVDTNVLAYLLIDGDRTPAAQRLFARDPDWTSEAFIHVEFTNVVVTYVRSGALAPADGERLLEDAQRLIASPGVVSHRRALDAALAHGVSAYDGRFIALARQTRRRLVTEDARLRAAAPEWTQSLADVAGA